MSDFILQLKSESFYPSTNCQTFGHHVAQLSVVPCQIGVSRAEVYFHPILLGCVLKTCQSQRVQTRWSSITNPLFASHIPISTSYLPLIWENISCIFPNFRQIWHMLNKLKIQDTFSIVKKCSRLSIIRFITQNVIWRDLTNIKYGRHIRLWGWQILEQLCGEATYGAKYGGHT